MKLKIYTLLLALCVTWSLQSCDNDDDNSIAVPTELQNAFASKYPNAANVKWETKCGYYVADFYDRNDWDFGYTEVDIIHNGISKDVLFDQTGDWHSTSWEVRQNELPEAVKNTINNQYGEYRFDEAKRIEKADGTIYYRIELEKMNVDLEVNINEDGIVIP